MLPAPGVVGCAPPVHDDHRLVADHPRVGPRQRGDLARRGVELGAVDDVRPQCLLSWYWKCGASHSSCPVGFTSADQRQPGSRVSRPISAPPMRAGPPGDPVSVQVYLLAFSSVSLEPGVVQALQLAAEDDERVSVHLQLLGRFQVHRDGAEDAAGRLRGAEGAHAAAGAGRAPPRPGPARGARRGAVARPSARRPRGQRPGPRQPGPARAGRRRGHRHRERRLRPRRVRRRRRRVPRRAGRPGGRGRPRGRGPRLCRSARAVG